MPKRPSPGPRRWVTDAEAIGLLGLSSRRALEEWISAGKLDATVRDGKRYVSGRAIDRRTPSDSASDGAADGLSPEEMTLLARPVLRVPPEPAPRAVSGQDLAESLPRVLEPYLNGLHEKIDDLSVQVTNLSEAIDRRPEPEVVHAEVVRPEPVSVGGAAASDLFETLRHPVDAEASPLGEEGGPDSNYSSSRGVPRFVYFLVAAGLAVLTAGFLLRFLLYD